MSFVPPDSYEEYLKFCAAFLEVLKEKNVLYIIPSLNKGLLKNERRKILSDFNR